MTKEELILQYAHRAAHGVELLDEKVPAWRDHIRPQHLRITSASLCVLGQLYGDFGRGRDALGLRLTDTADYGFMTHNTHSDHCAALQEVWLSILDPEA